LSTISSGQNSTSECTLLQGVDDHRLILHRSENSWRNSSSDILVYSERLQLALSVGHGGLLDHTLVLSLVLLLLKGTDHRCTTIQFRCPLCPYTQPLLFSSSRFASGIVCNGVEEPTSTNTLNVFSNQISWHLPVMANYRHGSLPGEMTIKALIFCVPAKPIAAKPSSFETVYRRRSWPMG
jgi:hypothetical protein